MRILQEEYQLSWQDAVTTAHELERLVRQFEQRQLFERGPGGENTR